MHLSYARRINEIVHGKRRITADTALRLAYYFSMPPRFWLGLQIDYDLDVAEDALEDIWKVVKNTRIHERLSGY